MLKQLWKQLLSGNPKHLWKRYIVAVALIAALLTTTHVAASMALQANAKDAVLINKSGRQRMLSQRIMFLSLRTADHFQERSREKLIESIELFNSSQNELAAHPKLSQELVDLYGPKGRLNARVSEFSALAQAIATNQGNTENALNRILVFDYDRLLKDLDEAVSGFERIADANARQLELVQNISFYAAIVILIVEGVLIFLPAQAVVTSSISRLQKQTEIVTKAKIQAVKRNQELEVLKEKVEHEAMHDALTGLPNRRSLQLSMQRLKTQAERDSATISVLHIDLDRFKQINDTLGHAAGDHVLQHVAKTLKECTRKSDVVARVGGDEFVILPGLNATSNDLSSMADKIIQAMRQPIPYKDAICQFGASIGIGIGISCAETSSVDPSDLLVKADIALYRAKELGRGRFEFFSDELATEVEAAKKSADELLNAFERSEFLVHYQPIFCSRTEEISTLEALVRWDHPEHGLQTAGVFMKQVERLGLAAELDKLVLEMVEKDVAVAVAHYPDFPAVALNVSASSLVRGDLLDRVQSSELIDHGLSLEISETVDFENDIEVIMEKIDRVRSFGVKIEVDDFGTGHASIFSFQKIEPDRVKIARELLSDVETSDKTRRLIQGTCRLARSFGADIVAEGAETRRMAQILQALGCDYIQGFGLSRPKSIDQLLCELSASQLGQLKATGN